jgi:hypothetical protein
MTSKKISLQAVLINLILLTFIKICSLRSFKTISLNFFSGICWILNRDKNLCNEKKIALTKFSENSYATFENDEELINQEDVFNPAFKYLDFDDSLTLVFEVTFKFDYAETSSKVEDKSSQEMALLLYFGTLYNCEELSDVTLMIGE